MTSSAVTIRKPTEIYGASWPYQVWIDGRRAGTIGRYDAVGTFRVSPGGHTVSVSTARFIRSEPFHVTTESGADAHLSVRRLAGARVPLKIVLPFLLPSVSIGPGSRWAARMLLPASAGIWAHLSFSLLLGLTLMAACLGFTLLVTPRYWVWWSLTSEGMAPPVAEVAPAYSALR